MSCTVQYTVFLYGPIRVEGQAAGTNWLLLRKKKVNQSLQCSRNTTNGAHVQCMYSALTYTSQGNVMFIKSKLFLYIE